MAKIRRVITVLGCLGVGIAVLGRKPAETAGSPSAAADASGPVKPIAVALAPAPVPMKPAQVAKVAPPPPAPIETPPIEETPYRLVLGLLDREAYPDVQVKASTVHIRYRLGSVWSVAMGRRTFDSTVAKIVPAMFARFPRITTIVITVEASTVDIRGNEGRGSAAEVEFTRRNAGNIRWGVIDTSNIERLADTAWYDGRFR